MKNKLLHMLRWDDRLTLVPSILLVTYLVYKGLPVLAVIFGVIFILAHAILLALSYSINRHESQQTKK